MSLVWFVDVFFFKQKTAYEMRISDWSSDVCSSDLSSTYPVRGFDACDKVEANFFRNGNLACARRTGQLFGEHVGDRLANPGGDVHFEWRVQIGRASCRERVCQYV